MFFQDLPIISNFYNKIKNNIDEINNQYKITKDFIKEKKYTEDVNKLLYQKLDELKNISLSYYNDVKLYFDKIKEFLEKSIFEIDDKIYNSSNITYKAIEKKYKEILDNYVEVNNKTNNEENKEISYKKGEFGVTINIHNSFDYQFEFGSEYIEKENEIPKIFGKSIIKNKVKQFKVDYYYQKGNCPKGKEMIINLNNISSSIEIDFNSSSVEVLVNKNYYLEKYEIQNNFYYKKEIYKNITIPGGPELYILDCTNLIPTRPPKGENNKEYILEIKNKNQETKAY